MRVNRGRDVAARPRLRSLCDRHGSLEGARLPCCCGVASPQQPLSDLRRDDDEECEPDANEPFPERQVHGVQDPLEETELRCEDDCRKRHSGEHEELSILEEVEVEERAPLVERCKREEEV